METNMTREEVAAATESEELIIEELDDIRPMGDIFPGSCCCTTCCCGAVVEPLS